MRSDGRALPAHSYLAQNNSLVIERVESTDEGRYICMAVTRYGRGQAEVELTVSGKNTKNVLKFLELGISEEITLYFWGCFFLEIWQIDLKIEI